METWRWIVMDVFWGVQLCRLSVSWRWILKWLDEIPWFGCRFEVNKILSRHLCASLRTSFRSFFVKKYTMFMAKGRRVKINRCFPVILTFSNNIRTWKWNWFSIYRKMEKFWQDKIKHNSSLQIEGVDATHIVSHEIHAFSSPGTKIGYLYLLSFRRV